MSTTMSPMQWNVKTTLAAAGAAAVVLYVLYASLPTSNDASGKSTLQVFKTWKMKDFTEIPDAIKEKMKSVKISEHTLTLKVENQEIEVFSRRVTPEKEASTPFNVLLLHGAAFTSKDWEKTETLQLLGAIGHKAIAIDLPGYGKSKSKEKLNSEKKAAFLAAFIEQENLGRPVLVSPSMSGSFSVPFLMGSKPITCTERVRGFIPVAPVGTDMYIDAQWHKCETPTMIVYGSKDQSLGLTSLNNLRNLANEEKFPMENAGHPAYIDKPEEWRYLLYNFMLHMEMFKE